MVEAGRAEYAKSRKRLEAGFMQTQGNDGPVAVLDFKVNITYRSCMTPLRLAISGRSVGSSWRGIAVSFQHSSDKVPSRCAAS